jgi:hypothetical protein
LFLLLAQVRQNLTNAPIETGFFFLSGRFQFWSVPPSQSHSKAPYFR